MDGNDVEAVHAMARRTIDRARAGDGPSLVEAVTYRHGGHSRADPGTYRPPEEVEAWLARDPIPAHRQKLLDAGVEAEALDAIDCGSGRGGGRGRGGGALRARAGPGDGDDPALGGRRLRMAEMTYRSAVAHGIAQEMERDSTVVCLGEDIGAAGGVFKTTEGLFARFGPDRVRDTPISEQAIIGAAMGAAMTGLRPVAELMFSDFFGVAWDMVANQIAKTRYMTDGQVSLPLVIRTANGGGLRFGAQHSQSIETWAMAIPGLKVVAPSTAADVVGLMAAAIRDPDPVIFCEHKALLADKADVPDGELVDELGVAEGRPRGDRCDRRRARRHGAAVAGRRRSAGRRGHQPRGRSTCGRSCRSTCRPCSHRCGRRSGCSPSRRTRGRSESWPAR